MKRIKNLLGTLLSICLLMGVWGINSYAASGTFSVDNKTVTVGSTVTVTARLNASEAIGAATINLTYNPSGLQLVGGSADVVGGGGNVRYFVDVMGQNKSSITFNMTFKVLKEGSFRVALSSTDIYTDATMDQIHISGGGGTITGKAQTTQRPTNPTNPTNPTTPSKDGNSKLNSLQVSPGALSPVFAAGTTAYTVKVPASTKELAISAAAQSSKSRVTVSGGKELKPGENEAKVTVVAEDGSATVYTINIICEDEEIIQIDGKDYTINENIPDDKIPTGFVKTEVSFRGKQYVALKNQKETLKLLSLKQGDTSKFYVFDEESKEVYPYVQIKLSEEKYIVPVKLNKNIKDFEKNEVISVELSGTQFEVWKLDEEYSLLCVINQDGDEGIYSYDHVDKTFQRYRGEVVIEETQQEEPSAKNKFFSVLEKYHLYIIIAMGVLVVVLSVTLIYFVATRKHRHRARMNKMQKKLEQQ